MTDPLADEPQFTAAEIDQVAELLTGANGSPSAARSETRIVAIDGRSGAGKSTLADLVAALTGATVISLEFLYGGWHDLEGGAKRACESAIEPLAKGKNAVIPQFDWLAETWGEPLVIEPGGLVIVEGAGAFTRRAELSVRAGIWLEAPEAVRRARANARDDGAFAAWWPVWAEQEAAHLAVEKTPTRATVTLLTG